jgi:hypothetical protein
MLSWTVLLEEEYGITIPHNAEISSQTTKSYIPEGLKRPQHGCKNLISHT